MNFDELFTKWKSEYSFNAFIRDGIVDPAHYDRPHILFILRDMNCRHERDLCADLRRDGSGWRTWNNIGRWTKALLDGDGEYPWDMSSPSRAAKRPISCWVNAISGTSTKAFLPRRKQSCTACK